VQRDATFGLRLDASWTLVRQGIQMCSDKVPDSVRVLATSDGSPRPKLALGMTRELDGRLPSAGVTDDVLTEASELDYGGTSWRCSRSSREWTTGQRTRAPPRWTDEISMAGCNLDVPSGEVAAAAQVDPVPEPQMVACLADDVGERARPDTT